MPRDQEGVNPRDTSSMPRGEDDEKTRANSPEFHDRPPIGRSTDYTITIKPL